MNIRPIYRKLVLCLFTISIILNPFHYVFAGGGPGTKPLLEATHFEPPTPAKLQKKVTPLEGKGTTNIGVYIYQQDNLRWKVEGECNGQELLNIESTNKPVSSLVCVDLSLEQPSYQPSDYKDNLGNTYPRSQITNSSIEPIYMDNTAHYRPGRPILVSVESFTGKQVKFTTQIGGVIEPIEYRPYNPPKYSADYIFNTDIYWRAVAEITKEINLTPGGQIGLNQTKQLQATVKTKTGDGNFGTETNVNTGSGGTTTWESSNPSVATVSNSGLVQAVSRGSTNITVLWEKDGFELTTRTTISVDQGNGGGNDNGGGDSGSARCTPTIGSPSPGTRVDRSDLDPNATGVIKSDNRGNETFNVLKGIPTSESLYTNAFADHYLFKQAWTKMSGKVTYNCNVTISYE